MAVFNDTLPAKKLAVYERAIERVEDELVPHRVEATPVEYDEGEPLRAECQHFIDCVRERGRPRTDGWNGLRVLAVLQASQRSIQTNGEPIVLRSSLQELIYV